MKRKRLRVDSGLRDWPFDQNDADWADTVAA
jgi:hypothetical protein